MEASGHCHKLGGGVPALPTASNPLP